MSPLRIPAFRHLWLGQAISQLGDSFYFVIFAFMTLKITGSPAMVGIVSALETLPYLLLSAYGGVVADRIDRRRIMLWSDCSSAGLLLLFSGVVYAHAGMPPVWTLMVTAFSLSVVRVFFMPAKGAAIPALVPNELMLKANSINATTQTVAPLISLSLSASVLAVLYGISPTWFFLSAVLLNMLSFVGSAIYVAKLPPIPPNRDAIHEVHPLKDLRDGIVFVRGRHELWVILVLQLLLNLMISPFFVVYLAANKAWFQNLPQNLAWLEFSFFLGMMIGNVGVGRLKIERPGLAFVWSVIVVGLAVFMMGFTPSFWFFVCWNMLAGIAIPFGGIPVMTYMQITVPDEYRGRVNSAMTMVSMGVQPVGLSLGGLLVQFIGIVGGFVTMGAGMSAAGALGFLDVPFRRMRLPGAQGEPGGIEAVVAAVAAE
ncbi:MAG TPA: MFS transporter [Fimbriimonadaceae bacterium]|nr:MFS transporter [Fimbriimonadaceae bacterium]